MVDGAPYFTLCRRLLDDPRDAIARHIVAIRPPVDDRPFFSHFFKWAALPQLLEQTGQNVAVHIGWGYMFLLITLAHVVPLGALLIFAPLTLLRTPQRCWAGYRRRTYLYFTALGFGFMFLELTAIQQFARFLPHPVFAFGIAIGLILLCAGLGARVSAHPAATPRRVFSAILTGLALHAGLWQASIALRGQLLFAADLLALALLAFFMGMPFPKGIEEVRAHEPELVPWAWGLNGFVSVLAILTAGLAALSWGLTAVIALSATAYLAAAFTFPARGRRRPSLRDRDDDDGIDRPAV